MAKAPKRNPLEYVNTAYGKVFQVGDFVQTMDGRRGMIVGGSNSVHVQIEGAKPKDVLYFHPTDVIPLPPPPKSRIFQIPPDQCFLIGPLMTWYIGAYRPSELSTCDRVYLCHESKSDKAADAEKLTRKYIAGMPGWVFMGVQPVVLMAAGDFIPYKTEAVEVGK